MEIIKRALYDHREIIVTRIESQKIEEFQGEPPVNSYEDPRLNRTDIPKTPYDVVNTPNNTYTNKSTNHREVDLGNGNKFSFGLNIKRS